jgi:hypothetical protein
MQVTYDKMGRFGNNLFQYFAAKIIEKIYGIENKSHCGNVKTLDDNQWEELCLYYMENNTPMEQDCDTFHLHGFFQISNVFNYFRDFLKELVENDPTLTHLKCDLKEYPGNNDVVIHIRLDDYMHEYHNTEIIHPSYFTNILDNLVYDKLYIVSDHIRHEYEHRYIKYFEKYNYIHITGTHIEDFNFIRNSNRIISSSSTFCWIAAFLSNAEEIHVPHVPGHGHAKMQKIGTCSKIYEVTYYN